MQIEVSQATLELIERQIGEEGCASADEVIERAISFYEEHRPTAESLAAKLLEAHAAYQAGDVEPFDREDVKLRGRERVARQQEA